MPVVVQGPQPEGFIDFVSKLKNSDNHFTLLFKGWKENDRGEKFADIEMIVQGFDDSGEATLNDLSDWLVQIGKNL